MKIFVLVLFLILSNCATPEKITKFNPSLETGCSNIEQTKERLICVSKMIKQLEDIRNSKIIIVEKKKLERVDQRYSMFSTLYCFTDIEEKEKFLCFESKKEEYDPTLVGIIIDYSSKIGVGFTIGIVTGIGVLK